MSGKQNPAINRSAAYRKGIEQGARAITGSGSLLVDAHAKLLALPQPMSDEAFRAALSDLDGMDNPVTLATALIAGRWVEAHDDGSFSAWPRASRDHLLFGKGAATAAALCFESLAKTRWAPAAPEPTNADASLSSVGNR